MEQQRHLKQLQNADGHSVIAGSGKHSSRRGRGRSKSSQRSHQRPRTVVDEEALVERLYEKDLVLREQARRRRAAAAERARGEEEAKIWASSALGLHHKSKKGVKKLPSTPQQDLAATVGRVWRVARNVYEEVQLDLGGRRNYDDSDDGDIEATKGGSIVGLVAAASSLEECKGAESATRARAAEFRRRIRSERASQMQLQQGKLTKPQEDKLWELLESGIAQDKLAIAALIRGEYVAGSELHWVSAAPGRNCGTEQQACAAERLHGTAKQREERLAEQRAAQAAAEDLELRRAQQEGALAKSFLRKGQQGQQGQGQAGHQGHSQGEDRQQQHSMMDLTTSAANRTEAGVAAYHHNLTLQLARARSPPGGEGAYPLNTSGARDPFCLERKAREEGESSRSVP